MADLNITAIREKYPQYADMSDDQLATGLHGKFYSDMPFDTFAEKIGYTPTTAYNEFGAVPTSEGAARRDIAAQTSAPGNVASWLKDAFTRAHNAVPPVGETNAEPLDTFGGMDASQPWMRGYTPPTKEAATRVGTAIKEGFEGGMGENTPEAIAEREKFTRGNPINTYAIAPALRLAGGAMGAVGGGINQTVMEMFGDTAGREILAGMNAFPMLHGESMAGPRAVPEAAPRPKFAGEHFAPDISQLDTRNAILELLRHDDAENPVAAPDRGTPTQSVDVQEQVMGAPTVDAAIEAARTAAGIRTPITATQVMADNPGMSLDDAYQRARQMNEVPPPEAQPQVQPGMRPETPRSAGAAGVPFGESLDTDAAHAAAVRHQGEVERFATPAKQNDQTEYIPGTHLTLAEKTGNPTDAADQALNRQQRAALAHHIDIEGKNAEKVATYVADTAGSATDVLAKERARSDQADVNIRDVFGSPTSERPPADVSSTIGVMDDFLTDPRHGERESVTKVIGKLREKFFDPATGELKSDPYQLYGVGEHINDLLNGVGDPEAVASARVLKRELTMIKENLYDRIEEATPGFAKYRADYSAASAEIDAMKFLQEERLRLLNKNLHVTPASWFNFMKKVIDGRTDPLHPAYGLSDAQMNRLWNVTDYLKRWQFIESGNPRGSWTSMMLTWGGNFARAGAHLAAAYTSPVIGNAVIEGAIAANRHRGVMKEMRRVLHPKIDPAETGP